MCRKLYIFLIAIFIAIGTISVPQIARANYLERDVVLLIDTSSSVKNDPLSKEKSTAKSFVNSMLGFAGTRISLISFSSSANVWQSFTTDANKLNSSIDSLFAGNISDMKAGFEKANEVFETMGSDTALHEIVLFSDGVVNDSNSEYAHRNHDDDDDDDTFSDLGAMNSIKNASSEAYDYIEKYFSGSRIWPVFLSGDEQNKKIAEFGKQFMHDIASSTVFDGDKYPIEKLPKEISDSMTGVSPWDRIHQVDFDVHTVNETESGSINVKWNRSWFDETASNYNNDLALTLESWCAAIGDDKYMTSDKAYMTELLKDFGFTDVEYRVDSSNLSGINFLMARQKFITIDGTTKNLYLLLVRGTSGDNEWISNLIFWPNTAGNVSGFTDGAEIALKEFEKYHAKFKADKNNDIFIVAGHSRGGAVANLVGKGLKNLGYNPDHSYIYGFAVPNTTLTINYTAADTNIFSVVSKDDPVPYLPPTSPVSSFTKYGPIRMFERKISEMKTIAKQILNKDKLTVKADAFSVIGEWHDYIWYLAWLSGETPSVYDNWDREFSNWALHCPVNITILRDDIEVGKIDHNRVVTNSEIDDPVPMFVNNDDKYFVLRNDANYKILIDAYDEGELSIDGPAATKYQNISLSAGEEFQISSDKTNLSDLQIVKDNKVIGSVDFAGSKTYLPENNLLFWEEFGLAIVILLIFIFIGVLVYRSIRKRNKELNSRHKKQ